MQIYRQTDIDTYSLTHTSPYRTVQPHATSGWMSEMLGPCSSWAAIDHFINSQHISSFSVALWSKQRQNGINSLTGRNRRWPNAASMCSLLLITQRTPFSPYGRPPPPLPSHKSNLRWPPTLPAAAADSCIVDTVHWHSARRHCIPRLFVAFGWY